MADDLNKELSKVTVAKPPPPLVPEVLKDVPSSYTSNNAKETLILQYAENFRRQFVHLYRDRKPLFLNPPNERATEKLVCTTLRPTLLPYKELYCWDGCAQFVSDYLSYEPLKVPNELPEVLPSPTEVLAKQSGNCFDFVTLLCSLLLGAGYDAYCVCGYASREITLMDQSRSVCPLLEKADKVEAEKGKTKDNKYDVKPPRDLRSKYILKMQEREVQARVDEEQKIKDLELAKIAEAEKPPPDNLYGMRVHCWVLVLAGRREVPENFFIEATTGNCVGAGEYLGIETLWNNCNYWVNMQDCSHGIGTMGYDLGDVARWEFMFPRHDKPLLMLPGEEEFDIPIDEEEEDIEDEGIVDMPGSWVSEITLPLADLQRRCPHGKKTILYKQARHEIFAEYLMQDGMVAKLTEFSDNALINSIKSREWFKHRVDKLDTREKDLITNKVTEKMLPGRPKSLREHVYYSNQTGSEATRVMTFDASARTDGLAKREETPVLMIEYFEGRDDCLERRCVHYTKRVKKFGPAEGNEKPITQVSEHYGRDCDIPADEDIAELSFLLSEERIFIKHHLQEQRIIASTKEFMKPPQGEDKGHFQVTPDMMSSFQVSPGAKNPKLIHIYTMLMDLLSKEEGCVENVRSSEQEVRDILEQRTHEELVTELSVSIYDTARNDTAKKRREEIERKKRDEEARREEMELDYLAPFLARIGDPSAISTDSAQQLKDDCLEDLKQRLIDMANLIQGRFEKETQQLEQKQKWYQQNQTTMSKEEEEEYVSYCSEAMFRIHILEQRLNRHKELAPQKYLALETRLRSDQRLCDYLN